jgi:hypothetical protein
MRKVELRWPVSLPACSKAGIVCHFCLPVSSSWKWRLRCQSHSLYGTWRCLRSAHRLGIYSWVLQEGAGAPPHGARLAPAWALAGIDTRAATLEGWRRFDAAGIGGRLAQRVRRVKTRRSGKARRITGGVNFGPTSSPTRRIWYGREPQSRPWPRSSLKTAARCQRINCQQRP